MGVCVCVYICTYIYMRKRETERDRDRETERETQRELIVWRGSILSSEKLKENFSLNFTVQKFGKYHLIQVL